MRTLRNKMKIFVVVVIGFALLLLVDKCAADKKSEAKGLQIGVKYKPKECTKRAKNGDTLKIHYTGTLLDGEKFDSSLDRNDPFQFKLGAGQVIKGWDRGLLNMCIGEKRKLTIPSDLGYGAGGMPPKIPGGATLVFETELIDIL
eukprot:EC121484.1.p1 GENE.EC121484.1~~EC121484.1.p1  ORF type:complete len:145 (+),score=23.89 EC121484.1:101-535(+)